jgi:hypothetical protein
MRGFRSSRVKGPAALAGLLFAAVLAAGARSEEPKLSISGDDPVAYFTDGNPVQGKAEIEYLWHKLRWRFASDAHRELFVKDPDRHTPQYGGYCAMGTSNDAEAHKDTVDPEAWAIVAGKLYFTHNQYWVQVWRENAEEHIKQGDRDWAALEIWQHRRLSGRLAPLLRRQPRSRCATAGIGSSLPGKSRATHPGMS